MAGWDDVTTYEQLQAHDARGAARASCPWGDASAARRRELSLSPAALHPRTRRSPLRHTRFQRRQRPPSRYRCGP